jgi:hypothetical protein
MIGALFGMMMAACTGSSTTTDEPASTTEAEKACDSTGGNPTGTGPVSTLCPPHPLHGGQDNKGGGVLEQ